jgi:hypothetical protein
VADSQAFFLGMVFGLPLVVLLIALVAGHLHRDDTEELLDWRPTRSPEREAQLVQGDVEQMLTALNRYRRLRGAPERSLEEVAERTWGEHAG